VNNLQYLFDQAATTQSRTIHLLDGAIVLYKRSGSCQWQCRFRLDNGSWFTSSTASDQVAEASTRAIELYQEAGQRSSRGDAVRTRTFAQLAKAELASLNDQLATAKSTQTIRDHIYVLERYLIPFFGDLNVTDINREHIDNFDSWRMAQMGRQPRASTQCHHATTFNRVMARADQAGLLNRYAKPVTLNVSGAKPESRPCFSSEEIDRLLAFMPVWESRRRAGRTQRFHDMARLCRCYVEFLLYTGIRQGTESMPMRWKDIQWHRVDHEQYLKIWVSGKTGPRYLIARAALKATLERLIAWQALPYPTLDAVIQAGLDRRVFTMPAGDQPYSMQGVFRRLLEDADLLRDPQTDQIRTLYSLRHTYATQALATGVAIHTVARQMGTSVVMLEKHYSKLTPMICAERLA
jgi:integrase